MEMREGLDLGCNFSPMTLVAVLGNPWFTRSYVYWCLSALLLSWPLRIIIECNTQYVDYQVGASLSLAIALSSQMRNALNRLCARTKGFNAQRFNATLTKAARLAKLKPLTRVHIAHSYRD